MSGLVSDQSILGSSPLPEASDWHSEWAHHLNSCAFWGVRICPWRLFAWAFGSRRTPLSSSHVSLIPILVYCCMCTVQYVVQEHTVIWSVENLCQDLQASLEVKLLPFQNAFLPFHSLENRRKTTLHLRIQHSFVLAKCMLGPAGLTGTPFLALAGTIISIPVNQRMCRFDADEGMLWSLELAGVWTLTSPMNSV